MEIIYIDSLFFAELIADYLLCLAAARICGLSLKRLRYFAAALFGAACSVLSLLPQFAFVGSGIAKLLPAAAMGIIAYGGEKNPLRCTAVLLAVCATFGGIILSLGIKQLDLRTFLLCFPACYGAITLISGCKARLHGRKKVQAELEYLGKRCSFTALVDSGNCLADPISGAEVMVVSPEAVKPVLGRAAELFALGDAVEILSAAEAYPELKGKLRLIPFSALGGSGLLPAFRPDRVNINGKKRAAILAAVSQSAAGEGFEAIIGI